MNKGDRFTVVVLGYVKKLPDAGFRPSALLSISLSTR
jgi:hypothetical protein